MHGAQSNVEHYASLRVHQHNSVWAIRLTISAQFRAIRFYANHSHMLTSNKVNNFVQTPCTIFAFKQQGISSSLRFANSIEDTCVQQFCLTTAETTTLVSYTIITSSTAREEQCPHIHITQENGHLLPYSGRFWVPQEQQFQPCKFHPELLVQLITKQLGIFEFITLLI